MFKKSTIDELERIGQSFNKNISFLFEKCEGILRNEIEKKFIQKEEIKNQEKLIKSINRLSAVVRTINSALKEGNAEKLRAELVNYYAAIETIFTASLTLHSANEVQKNGVSNKGRYLDVHRKIIKDCRDAQEIAQFDRHAKGEMGNSGRLVESVKSEIKGLSYLLGVKTISSKEEKVVYLNNISSSKNHADITITPRGFPHERSQ